MIKTNAFILKWIPFAEADRIVTVFTECSGKIHGIARGSLKMNSRITGTLEPLTHVELRYVAPYGRELVIITGCDSYSSLFGDIKNLRLASAIAMMAELTIEFNVDNDPNQAFYRLLTVCHDALKEGRQPMLVLRYFELFTLKLAGFLPGLETLRSTKLRSLAGHLLKTHIDSARCHDEKTLNGLGVYLRRVIRQVLGKPLKSYIIHEQFRQLAG